MPVRLEQLDTTGASDGDIMVFDAATTTWKQGLTPTAVGAALFAKTATKLEIVIPITSEDGWLANDDGELLYEGA